MWYQIVLLLLLLLLSLFILVPLLVLSCISEVITDQWMFFFCDDDDNNNNNPAIWNPQSAPHRLGGPDSAVPHRWICHATLIWQKKSQNENSKEKVERKRTGWIVWWLAGILGRRGYMRVYANHKNDLINSYRSCLYGVINSTIILSWLVLHIIRET